MLKMPVPGDIFREIMPVSEPNDLRTLRNEGHDGGAENAYTHHPAGSMERWGVDFAARQQAFSIDPCLLPRCEVNTPPFNASSGVMGVCVLGATIVSLIAQSAEVICLRYGHNLPEYVTRHWHLQHRSMPAAALRSEQDFEVHPGILGKCTDFQ